MELKNEMAKFKIFPINPSFRWIILKKTEYITTANIPANTSQKYMAYPDENLIEK